MGFIFCEYCIVEAYAFATGLFLVQGNPTKYVCARVMEGDKAQQ